MDILALLGPASASVATPSAGTPAVASAVPGDAFAAAFASAMAPMPVVAPATVVLSGATGPATVPVIPTIALPAAPDRPTGAKGAGARPERETPTILPAPTSSPEAKAPSPVVYESTVAPAPTESKPTDSAPDAAPEETTPTPAKVRAPRTSASRTKARPPAPPGSPPLATAPAASEKEAPTNAPNAPVTPLDRTSEKNADETPTLVGDADASPVPVLPPVLPASAVPPTVVLVAVVPTAEIPRIASTVASVETMPVATAPTVASPTVSAKIASPDPSVDEGVGEDDPGAIGRERSIAPETMSVDPRESGVPNVPTPTLPNAPDLGIAVPVVAVAPVVVAPTSNGVAPIPIAAAPNAQVAEVAAGRSVAAPVPIGAPVVEKPEAPPAKPDAAKADAPIPATVVAKEDASQRDEEAADDAPNDPTPLPTEMPTVKTAATERPEAGDARPSVDRHLVVRQVADRIESLAASRPKDGVTIHLEPRDLGTVTLVVKGLQKALDVQVFASDDRVRQSLDASRAELAQRLAPRGLEVRELRVSTTPPTSASTTSGANADGNASPNRNADSQSRPRSQSPSSSFSKASRLAEPTSTPSRAARSGRGVDLLV